MARSTLAILLILTALSSFSPTPLRAESDLGFADSLFVEGDYYRAVTEYKRFLHHHPDDPSAPYATLRMARSFLAGERWEEAEEQLERLQEGWPASPEALRGAMLYAEIPYRQKNYQRARTRYSLLSEQHPQLLNASRYRIAWSHIEEGDYASARQQLAHIDQPPAAELSVDLTELEQLPEKSPQLAGTLSALLPGAGQLYVGRNRDAALSFALNAAFIFAAIEAFDNDNEVLGGILIFFELGWYTGNIYNATNSAHKHNRDLREEVRQRLRNRHGLDLAVGPDAAMLNWTWRF